MPLENSEWECVILTSGEAPNHPMVRWIIKPHCWVVRFIFPCAIAHLKYSLCALGLLLMPNFTTGRIVSNCFGYNIDFSKAGVSFCCRRIFPYMEPVILTDLIMCHTGVRVYSSMAMLSLSCEVTFKLSLVKITVFTASSICLISVMISTLLTDSTEFYC